MNNEHEAHKQFIVLHWCYCPLISSCLCLCVWRVQTRYFATFPNIPGCNRKSFWTGNFTRSGWVLLNWAGSTHLLYCFYVSLLSVDPVTEIAKPSKLAAKCRSSISRISANFEFVKSKNAVIGQHAFFSKPLTNVANASYILWQILMLATNILLCLSPGWVGTNLITFK